MGNNLESKEIHTVRANGIDFAYHEVGQGPLVLCLHGFPDTAQTWIDLLPLLADAGYRAVAPYMRGYAPSSVPEDKDFRVWTLGQDVLALIEALGEERATVVGHDWGASAVYSAAVQGKERIERLVALAIPPPAGLKPGPDLLWAVRHFIAFQRKKATIAKYNNDPMGFLRELYTRWSPRWDVPDEELVSVAQCFEQPGALESALGYYWALVRGVTSKETRVLGSTKIDVPTLMIGGDADILPVKYWKGVERGFTAPNKVEIVSGVGHFLHREKPAQVNSIILDWLADST
jgi:pimeloyl-ACP methyl ester carboxylesterase